MFTTMTEKYGDVDGDDRHEHDCKSGGDYNDHGDYNGGGDYNGDG